MGYPRICLVGNSEKVLDHTLGSVIDSFDIVIRFNEFILDGFETYVGTKTDYIFLGPLVLNRLDNIDPEYSKILVCSSDYDFMINTYPKHDIVPINYNYGKHKLSSKWTSGAHVLFMFSEIYPDADIFTLGIADGGSAHYWNTAHIMSPQHDLKYELDYFKSLNIKQLNDYCISELRTRNDFPKLLNTLNLTGNWLELGVAKADFHKQLYSLDIGQKLWGIDKWDDHHNVSEYIESIKKCPRSTFIRSTFDEALPVFEDEFFDFIYVDGYAHTGQNSGNTLINWYPKLKSGGVFAGHDYSLNWAPTIIAVDKFVKANNLKLYLTSDDEYNSWWVIKP